MSKKIPIDILMCPECSSENLEKNQDCVICGKCGSHYAIEDGIYRFFCLEPDDVHDPFDKLKHFFKRFSKLYNFLIFLISPVYSDQKELKSFLDNHVNNKDVIAVNLGSGSSDISDKVSNVDVFAYNNVDLTCSVEKLPFRDESVDAIVNIAVLEHLPNPETVVDEFYRILKKGGVIYLHFPFIQGFHASPDDFSRRTYEGIKVLLKDFEELDINMSG